MCGWVNGKRHCVYNGWTGTWLATDRPKLRRLWWHGSLVEDKQDAAGTFYRRNRYLDARTGRFTQEDPIGLAGGVNVYGYAAGDPVTYSDPYGLCPHAKDPARRSSDLSTCTREDFARINGGLEEPLLSPADFGNVVRVGRGFLTAAVRSPVGRALSTAYLRRRAVRQAWRQEQQLVQRRVAVHGSGPMLRRQNCLRLVK